MPIPTEDLNKIEAELREFEAALFSSMGPTLGAPLTRPERALLVTFAHWRAQRAQPTTNDQTQAAPVQPQDPS